MREIEEVLNSSKPTKDLYLAFSLKESEDTAKMFGGD